MSYKILTKNGVENTNIDDARNHHFNSGGKSGIVKGELNEGNVFSGSSNVIALDTCELRLCGHRVIVNEAEYITLSSTPAQAIRYSLIAEIKVVDSNPSFSLFYQAPATSLIQNNLSADLLGNGTYQMEIGKFTLNTDGTISDIVRTADLINGGGNNGEGGHINIGTITTNTLDAGMEAEIDIEERYDAETNKTYTDFTFSIPKGDEGKQGPQGIQGIQGERGEQGPRGEIGKSNTLTIGTVTSGTTASATISGTAPNQVLNLVLPKGEQGEQGVQGPQGDSIQLYQTTGTSTTGSMSQNAITNELNEIKNSASSSKVLWEGSKIDTNAVGVTIPASDILDFESLQPGDVLEVECSIGASVSIRHRTPTIYCKFKIVEVTGSTGNPTGYIEGLAYPSYAIGTTIYSGKLRLTDLDNEYPSVGIGIFLKDIKSYDCKSGTQAGTYSAIYKITKIN